MLLRLWLIFALAILAACSTSEVITPPVTHPDAEVDAGVTADAGHAAPDADPPPDAGFITPDGGFDPTDTGVRLPDGGFDVAPCDPALSLAPSRSHVLPLDLVDLVAAGGTGAYQFELVDDASGGLLNPVSGSYLSGSVAGVTDRFVVRDSACLGTAEAIVQVVEPMQVQPMSVELGNGEQLQYLVTSGSGSFDFTVIDARGGGTVTSAGLYQAPTGRTGRDVIEIRDEQSQETVNVTVDVVVDGSLRPSPPHVHVPVGSRFTLPIGGGSGRFSVVSSSTVVTVLDNEIHGLGHGRALLDITDAFTGRTTQLTVDSIGAQTFTATRAGDYYAASWVVGPGDLNGDGYDDALLGIAEADMNGWNSGAVFVYRGGPNGLEPEPAQILTGENIEDRFGRALTAADFNGDGEIDLAVGSERGDRNSLIDTGTVRIFRGVANGFFEDTAWEDLGGQFSYDYFGFALAACDFNADGVQDLAVGAWLGEDRTQQPIRWDQGGVHIYLGRSRGFRDEPDQSVYGEVPNGDGTYSGINALRIGGSIAAADLDGDGACDVATGTNYYRAAPGASNDGLVLVYRGRTGFGADLGGIQPRPSRVIGADEADDRASQFGRYLAAGDLDGDGAAELVVSQYLSDVPGRVNVGAVRVFGGGALLDTPANGIESVASADWTWRGNNPQDQSGWLVSVRDFDGDLVDDLLVSSFYEEVDGGTVDVGAVSVFRGRVGVMPDAIPTSTVAGYGRGDRFGLSFDVVGDTNADGAPDMLVFADLNDRIGVNVGQPWFISGARPDEHVALDYPGEPAGAHAGRGLAIVDDLNGDGLDDLAMGAPAVDFRDRGVNTGAVMIYAGGDRGFSRTPATTLSHFPNHSDSDWFGWSVTTAGDFDGDGTNDIAVLARFEDRPGGFNANTYDHDGCTGYRGNVGAIYVFLGTPGGWPDNQPDFVWYGPQQYQQLWTVRGGFDYDGDGLGDLLVGSLEWDRPGGGGANAGGFALLRGRARTADGRIRVLCDADFQFFGHAANQQMGRSVTPMGDVDGDGCDDFAVGANGEVRGNQLWEGSARVVFGWGGTCGASPEAVTMFSSRAYYQGGYAVDGGHDVDGDGIPDLVAGSIWYYENGLNLGSAWLVSGARIRVMPRTPLIEGQASTSTLTFADADDPRVLQLVGEEHRAFFSHSLALVPNLEGDGRAGLAVGLRDGTVSGMPRGGGAMVYRFDRASGFVSEPVTILGGDRFEAFVGENMSAGWLQNRPVIAVGAPFARGQGMDMGNAMVVDLKP